MQEPLWKVRDLARRLSISIPQAYRLLHSGAISLVRVGKRSLRVREKDVEKYIRDQREGAPPKDAA